MGDATSVGSVHEQKDAPFPLTEIDLWVLAQKDEDYHFHDWTELTEIIGGHISQVEGTSIDTGMLYFHNSKSTTFIVAVLSISVEFAVYTCFHILDRFSSTSH
jgi:hypothetical protein